MKHRPLPPFKRRRQQTAEQSLKYAQRGGLSSLHVKQARQAPEYGKPKTDQE